MTIIILIIILVQIFTQSSDRFTRNIRLARSLHICTMWFQKKFIPFPVFFSHDRNESEKVARSIRTNPKKRSASFLFFFLTRLYSDANAAARLSRTHRLSRRAFLSFILLYHTSDTTFTLVSFVNPQVTSRIARFDITHEGNEDERETCSKKLYCSSKQFDS